MDESELTQRLEALERRVLWSDILSAGIFVVCMSVGICSLVMANSDSLHKLINFQMHIDTEHEERLETTERRIDALEKVQKQ